MVVFLWGDQRNLFLGSWGKKWKFQHSSDPQQQIVEENASKPSLGMPSAMFACCNQVDDNNASWDAIDGLGKRGTREGWGVCRVRGREFARLPDTWYIHTFFFIKLDKNRIQRSLAVFQSLLFCLSNPTFFLSDVCNYYFTCKLVWQR